MTDHDDCTSCGACVDACPFDARVLDAGDRLRVLPGRCYGCGVCVPRCPGHAISLVRR
ncbi:MAG: 4Fe-4S binding protein [Promethearchaeota archaeon]